MREAESAYGDVETHLLEEEKVEGILPDILGQLLDDLPHVGSESINVLMR